MIQKGTQLTPADNCGVWTTNVFQLYKGAFKKIAFPGDYIKISVRKTKPANWVVKKTKSFSIVVHTRKELIKLDGSYIKFNLNSNILFKKRLTPKGSQIIGPGLFIMKRKKFLKNFASII